MALSLRASPFLSPRHLSPATPRPRARAAVVSAGASAARRRRSQNVDGEFFVDHRCIDCDTCRWMAPEVFKRVDGMSAVAVQPSSQEERVKALQALLSCPTASIHTEKPPKEILEVQKMFPLPIDENVLPGVYHCGYHSELSYGATSYFITHPEGNILVDSPKYKVKLATNLEMLGGARYIFLTHRDDVGDHAKWAERLKCERIIHSGDVESCTADVEMKLDGNGPWSLGSDFDIIYTPGHTRGSICLYYKPQKVLFSGDHIYKSEETDDLAISLIYNQQSGHGRRIEFRDNQEKNSAIEALLARMAPRKEHVYA